MAQKPIKVTKVVKDVSRDRIQLKDGEPNLAKDTTCKVTFDLGKYSGVICARCWILEISTLKVYANANNLKGHVQENHDSAEEVNKSSPARLTTRRSSRLAPSPSPQSSEPSSPTQIIRERFLPFFCEADTVGDMGQLLSIIKGINAMAYPLSGCWYNPVKSDDRSYVDVMHLKSGAANLSEHHICHSVQCELIRNPYSEGHIPCMRPSHLKWGTPQENSESKVVSFIEAAQHLGSWNEFAAAIKHRALMDDLVDNLSSSHISSQGPQQGEQQQPPNQVQPSSSLTSSTSTTSSTATTITDN